MYDEIYTTNQRKEHNVG